MGRRKTHPAKKCSSISVGALTVRRSAGAFRPTPVIRGCVSTTTASKLGRPFAQRDHKKRWQWSALLTSGPRSIPQAASLSTQSEVPPNLIALPEVEGTGTWPVCSLQFRCSTRFCWLATGSGRAGDPSLRCPLLAVRGISAHRAERRARALCKSMKRCFGPSARQPQRSQCLLESRCGI